MTYEQNLFLNQIHLKCLRLEHSLVMCGDWLLGGGVMWRRNRLEMGGGGGWERGRGGAGLV